jgi:hypothetical protein
MSDYTQVTFFEPKDALDITDPEKILLGADLDPELLAISTAVASKMDNTGEMATLSALTDPGADRLLFWDDGATAYAYLVPNDGLATDGTNLNLDILGLTNRTAIANDVVAFWDVAGAQIGRESIGDLVQAGLVGETGGTLHSTVATQKTKGNDSFTALASFTQTLIAKRYKFEAELYVFCGASGVNMLWRLGQDASTAIFDTTTSGGTILTARENIDLDMDNTADAFQYRGLQPIQGNSLLSGSQNAVVLDGTNGYVIRIQGTVDCSTGGTIEFAWAQAVSNATAIELEAGSSITYTQLN